MVPLTTRLKDQVTNKNDESAGMSIAETLRSFSSGLVDWNQRPVALNFGQAQSAVGHRLALHHADIHEGLLTGIDGYLNCVSTHDNLSPKLLLGLPVSVRLTTDRGGRRSTRSFAMCRWANRTAN